MIFQGSNDTVWFIVGLIIATVVLWLVMYFVSSKLVSKNFASEKKFMIFLCAFLIVLLVPIVSGAIGMVLGAIGDLIGQARQALSLTAQNYLTALVPVVAFLLILVLVRFIVGIDRWDRVVWLSLISLFLLYLFYTIIPEIPQFLDFAGSLT